MWKRKELLGTVQEMQGRAKKSQTVGGSRERMQTGLGASMSSSACLLAVCPISAHENLNAQSERLLCNYICMVSCMTDPI